MHEPDHRDEPRPHREEPRAHRDEPRHHLTDSGSIPIDPDVEVDETDTRPARPPHLRWGYIGLVGVGGAVGTAVRAWLADALPPVAGGLDWTILAINVVGAFCLGTLLEGLAHRGADVGRRRRLRLLVGTGVLGGFTTYSTLADGTAKLLDGGQGLAGTGYALLTVVAGLAAVVAGLWVAALLRPASAGSSPGLEARRASATPVADTEGER